MRLSLHSSLPISSLHPPLGVGQAIPKPKFHPFFCKRRHHLLICNKTSEFPWLFFPSMSKVISVFSLAFYLSSVSKKGLPPFLAIVNSPSTVIIFFPQNISPPVPLCLISSSHLPSLSDLQKFSAKLKPSQALSLPDKGLVKLVFSFYYLEKKWWKLHDLEAYVRESV